MKAFLLSTLLGLSTTAQAVNFDQMHCQSENTELALHTIFYKTIAVGDYTVVYGEREDFPALEQPLQSGQPIFSDRPLIYYSRNMFFHVEKPLSAEPRFRVRMQVGKSLIDYEEGTCEKSYY